MYRFFVDPAAISDGTITISGADVNHIVNVLRMRPGEVVLLSTGDEWEYTCRIETLDKACVICRIEDAQKAGRELPSSIYLFQCLPKGDKMETIIQKAVELGAAGIIPVKAKRCIVKLDAKKEKTKTVRWNAIAESAAKQAKRMCIPEVSGVLPFSEALAYARQHASVCLIPYEKAESMEATRKVLADIRPGQSVAVMIGPEGGFEEEEVQEAIENGFSPITLGRRILRTETAGMTVLSILMYLLEDREKDSAGKPGHGQVERK